MRIKDNSLNIIETITYLTIKTKACGKLVLFSLIVTKFCLSKQNVTNILKSK